MFLSHFGQKKSIIRLYKTRSMPVPSSMNQFRSEFGNYYRSNIFFLILFIRYIFQFIMFNTIRIIWMSKTKSIFAKIRNQLSKAEAISFFFRLESQHVNIRCSNDIPINSELRIRWKEFFQSNYGFFC